MWFDLYVVMALVVAVAAWLAGPHFRSYDPPSDFTRVFWSTAAGALWPVFVVGAAQIYAVCYLVRRLRPTGSSELDLALLSEPREVSLHS